MLRDNGFSLVTMSFLLRKNPAQTKRVYLAKLSNNLRKWFAFTKEKTSFIRLQ